MSRTLSADFQTHIAGTAHTRCAMLRIDLVDGTSIALTDHDQTLSFNLGDGAVDYEPDTGILPSDLSLSAGFDADDMEVTGPIGDVVTRAAVIGGRFDDAVVRYFFVNWSDLTQGAAKLVKGRIVLAEVEGGRFKFTMHSEVSKFSQSIGLVITAYCRHDFGDAQCQAVPETLAATITAVTDELGFAVSYTGTYASDFWNRGTVSFDTGTLAGIRPVEIFDFTSGGAGAGSLVLLAPLPEAPQVGDTLTLTQGCERIRTACMAFNNIANFGGFPDVPGSDQVLRYPNPGG